MNTIYEVYKDVASSRSSYAIFLECRGSWWRKEVSRRCFCYHELKWVQRHLVYRGMTCSGPIIQYSHLHVYWDIWFDSPGHFGAQCLAQRHFNMQTRGIEPDNKMLALPLSSRLFSAHHAARLLISSRYALAALSGMWPLMEVSSSYLIEFSWVQSWV